MASHKVVRPKEALLKEAPGKFVRLSFGTTHYELLSPAEAPPADRPLVVCVHGISAHGEAWREFGNECVAAGYRVLLPDLYGRGYSDAPDVPNDVTLFTTQLAELLLEIGPETDYASVRGIYLVGVSMGGAVSSDFARLHPRLVKKLVLVAPAVLVSLPGSAKFALLPGVTETLLGLGGKGVLTKNVDRAYALKDESAEHIEATKKRTIKWADNHPGWVDAFISTTRNLNFGNFGTTLRVLGEHKEMPILLVWGTKDEVVPYVGTKVFLESVPHVKLETLEGAGHADFWIVPRLKEQLYTSAKKFLFDNQKAGSMKGERRAKRD